MSARSCSLAKCWCVGGDTPVLGMPTVAGASVAAEVLDHKRGPKVIAFKKRRRKNSRRKRGYRDEITVLRITEILTDGKPTIGPRPKREKVASPPTEGDDEAPKAATKKAVRRQPPRRRAAAAGEGQKARCQEAGLDDKSK